MDIGDSLSGTEKSIIYIPALSGGDIATYLNNEPRHRIYSTKNNPFYSLHQFDETPIVLISAGSHYKKSSIRYDLGIPIDETKVFTDSGGFQLKMNTGNITDAQALEWCENNGDIFPILDRPTGSAFYDNKEAMELSLASAKYYYENRKHKGEEVLNVLQGENQGEMENWYEQISQFEFDGWGMGGIMGVSEDTELTREAKFAEGLITLFRNKELEKEYCKRLHFFGVGSIKFMIYFQYIQMLMNEMSIDLQITCDTSSYSFVAKNGIYWLGRNDNDSMSGVQITKEYEYNQSNSFSLPCRYQCPVCKEYEDVPGAFMEFNSDGKRTSARLSNLITLHNLYVQKMVEKEIKNILLSRCFSTYQVFFSLSTVANLKLLSKIFGKTRDRGKEALKLLKAVFGEDDERFI